MNFRQINLGQILTIGANLGVIAGILLLAYELNQNRALMQAQTRSDISQGYTQIMFQFATDEGVSDILFRGTAGEQLTEAESNRFRQLIFAQIGYMENVYYQYKKGLYEEVEFSAHRNRWKVGFFGSEAVVDVWCIVNGFHSPEFVEEVNELLDQACG